jgi:hypothetical protein
MYNEQRTFGCQKRQAQLDATKVALGKYENHASKAIMRVGLKKYVLFYHHEVKKGSVWLAFVYIEEKSS